MSGAQPAISNCGMKRCLRIAGTGCIRNPILVCRMWSQCCGMCRAHYRRHGFHENHSGSHPALDDAALCHAWHGRLRPERHARSIAALFRSGRREHRHRRAARALAGRIDPNEEVPRRQSATWASIRKNPIRSILPQTVREQSEMVWVRAESPGLSKLEFASLLYTLCGRLSRAVRCKK